MRMQEHCAGFVKNTWLNAAAGMILFLAAGSSLGQGFSVIAPSGGDVYTVGQTVTIRWSSTHAPATKVMILLSRDGGATWPSTLAGSTANSGQYNWTASGPPSTRCKIAVGTSPSDAGASGNFTIRQIVVPTASTQAATGITARGATLNGTIGDDGGAACQYQFRYKKAGGTYASTGFTGSVRTGQAFSYPLSGLDPGTTYYFAAQAQNSAGAGPWTGDLSFTTLPTSPSVACLGATNVGVTSATLNGRISDDGGAVCQYEFRYKKESGSYTSTGYTGAVHTGDAFSYPLSGLEPGTSYYFSVRAKNSAGETGWIGGGDAGGVWFATKSLPGAPTATSATNITQTTATLNAVVPAGNDQGCAYQFRLKISGGTYTYTGWTGSVSASQSFSQAVSGLTPKSTYSFAAQLRNSAGDSGSWGGDVSFTTLPPKPTATTLPATGVSATGATLNGAVADDGGDACQYRFRYKEFGASSYTTGSWTGSVRKGQSFSTAIPSGLTAGKTYVFAAQLQNSGGEGAWGGDQSFTTSVGKAMATTLPATGVSATAATLNGTISDDAGAVCQYQFRYKKASGNYTYTGFTGSVRTGQAFSFPLTGLDPGSTYSFAAQANNSSAGAGPWGTDLSFTTPPLNPTATTQVASGVTANGATLNGLVVNDGGEACSCEFRYRVTPDKTYKTVPAAGQKKRTGESFSLEVKGSNGAVCYYSARVTNSAGSSTGDELSFTFAAGRPTVTVEPPQNLTGPSDTHVAVRLRGNLVSDGGAPCEYQFRYQKKIAPAAGTQAGHSELALTPWTCVTQLSSPLGQGAAPSTTPCPMVSGLPFPFTWDVSGLDPNCTYEVAAHARNSAGEGAWSASLTFTTPLMLPKVVMLPATNVGPDHATVNCKVISDGGAPCYVHWRIADQCITAADVLKGCTGVWHEFPMFAMSPAGEPSGGLRTGQSSSHSLPDANELSLTFTKGLAYKVQVKAYNTASDKFHCEWSAWSAEEYFRALTPPVVWDPCGTHFDMSMPVTFLAGIPLDEQVTATVWWYDRPLRVDWYIQESTGELTLYASTDRKGVDWQGVLHEDVSQTIRVTDFHVGDSLVVIPRGDDGTPQGYPGNAKVANFTLRAPPRLPPGFSLAPLSYDLGLGPGEPLGLKYEASRDGVVVIGDHLTDFEYKVCKDIFGKPDVPLHGGVDAGISAAGDMKFTVEGGRFVRLDYKPTESSYTMSKHPEGTTSASLKLAGEGPDGNLRYSLDLKADLTDTDQDTFEEIKDDGTPTTVTTDYAVNYSAPSNTFTAATWDGQKPAWRGEIPLQREYYAHSWQGIPYGFGIETTIIGGLTSDMFYSGVGAGGDPFKCYCFDMTTTVKFWIFGLNGVMEQRHWYCCPANSGCSSTSVPLLSAAAADVAGAGLQLMDRDYLGSDYAVWRPPHPDESPTGGSLSVQSAPTGAQAASGEEQVLQTNVFKLSQPALAADQGELLLAWIYDDPKRSAVNREQVVFSRSNGQAWTPPAPIWDDGTADFSPQLAVLPTRRVLCTWENVNKVLPDNAGLKDVAAALDIAVASYDSVSGRWDAKVLTNNSYFDHTPQIAAAANNTAVLTWISNEKNDPLGSDPNARDTIRYCLWNGSRWSEPAIAAAGIRCLGVTALAYSGTQAVYVYSAAPGGNAGTIADRELFALVYDGIQWSPPMRLTNDKVLDTNPQVVYDRGEPLLVWSRDKSIVSCRGLDATNLQQVVPPSGVGAMDFRLAKSPGGDISLVWTGLSTKSVGLDVFTAAYDHPCAVWSNIHTLTSDKDYEQALTPTYVGSLELALAYNKARITTDGRGNQKTYQTDLCVLRHTGGRDLAVTAADLSLSPTDPKPGEAVTVTAVIHNLGDVAEVNVPVGFYYGDPADKGALIGGMRTIKGPIPAAGTGSISISYAIPKTGPLEPIYVVVFDVEGPRAGLQERDWDNNIASIPLVLPRLRVASFYSKASEPKVRRITARIANDGAVAARNVGVTIRQDSPTGKELQRLTIPVIGAGSTENASWDWDIANLTFPKSEMVLCATIDIRPGAAKLEQNDDKGFAVVYVSRPGDITDDGSIDK